MKGQGLPEHLCNNTESALANELMTHALTLSLVNESWVPPLLATLGGNCHWAVGCAADALFAGHPVFRIRRPLPDLKSGLRSQFTSNPHSCCPGLHASSWLHGTKNLTEQSLDPLLWGGWNAIIQRSLRQAAPQGDSHLATMGQESMLEAPLSYGSLSP